MPAAGDTAGCDSLPSPTAASWGIQPPSAHWHPHWAILTPSAGHTDVIAVTLIGEESPETQHKLSSVTGVPAAPTTSGARLPPAPLAHKAGARKASQSWGLSGLGAAASPEGQTYAGSPCLP